LLKVSVPTKGLLATLNAKAEKGSLSEDVQKVSSPSSINSVITINSRYKGM